MALRKNSQFRDLRKKEYAFYDAWCHAKSRCTNKNGHDYHRYGGRGIAFSESWFDFANFYTDMYESWKKHKATNPQTTLDRIDVDGNYCKENCRWATQKVQSNNRRKHNMLTFNQETHNLVQWAEKLHINRSTLAQRIYVYGWSVDKALTT
jgi:hypothetical protein